jgi:hypothetical protein
MAQEFADCAAFFSVGAQCSENTIPGSGALGRKSAEWAVKDMFLEGPIVRITNEALQARLRLTLRAESEWIKNNCVNIAILLERFGDVCKPLLENPNNRFFELLSGGAPWDPIP